MSAGLAPSESCEENRVQASPRASRSLRGSLACRWPASPCVSSLPPGRTVRGSARGGESRIPPLLSTGTATYSGGSSLAAPLGTAARCLSPAPPPLPSHSCSWSKRPWGYTRGRGGGNFRRLSSASLWTVGSTQKRGQVFLPSPCWG